MSQAVRAAAATHRRPASRSGDKRGSRSAGRASGRRGAAARGRRRRTSNQLVTRVAALKQLMGPSNFWFAAAFIATALVGLGLCLGTGWGTPWAASASGTSTGATSSPSATASPYPGYEDNSAYVTPGWNNATNRANFTVLVQEYEREIGVASPNPGNLYAIGIDNCIQLRAGRSDRIVGDAKRETALGKTWAITNAAIDVYCPDQSQYRDLVAH